MLNFNPLHVIISLPAILIAISFHEYAHGLAANALGDDTPYYQGRLTINPLAHIDVIGMLMMLIGPFGWAKPVEVNPMKFRGIGAKRGMMLVSMAGPGMNFFMAFLAAVVVKLVVSTGTAVNLDSFNMIMQPIIIYNVFFGVFNLLPVPPLDGYKVLAGFLPDELAYRLYGLEPYGFWILLILILTGATRILYPIAQFLMNGLNLFIAM